MRYLLLIALEVSALGQDVVPTRRLNFQLVSSTVQPDLSGVAYRWVSCDCQTNVSINNWTDEIQGAVWTNPISANQPTNAQTGIWFDDTHWFTNAGLTIGSNCSFGLIIDVIDCGQFSGDVHPGLINNNRTSDDAALLSLQFDFNQSPKYPLIQRYDATLGDVIFTSAPFRTTNQWCDILFSQALTNNSGVGSIACYTNGIAGANSPAPITFGVYYWGSRDSAFSGLATHPASLMLNPARNTSAFSRLREFWIWTNHVGSTGTLLGSSQIANFHSYAQSVSNQVCGQKITTPGDLGANFWWVAGDLTNNAHVTNWTDRIAGSVLNSTASGYPSNLSDGVHFSMVVNQGLTNTAAPPCNYGPNCSHFIIAEFTNSLSFQAMLAAGNTGSGASLMDTSVGGNPDWTIQAATHNGAKALPLNAFFDITFVSSNGAAPFFYYYTNGNQSDRISGSTISTNIGIVGWAASEALGGIIREIAVWTNTVDTPTTIAALHTYATNKYGYSP